MRHKTTIEVLLIAVLVFLAVSTLNPYWMPMGMQLVAFSALIVLFGAFSVYLWREKGGDERESDLLNRSDRIGFLAGAAVLLIAVVYEGIVHSMEAPWVTGALLAMIIAKLVSYMYLERK